MNNLSVYAVIQARMGSSRLPGKILMDVAGKPLLWHIVHRLRQCKNLTGIAVATSTDRADDALIDFGEKYGVPIIRGSEDDVLQRYIDAGEALKADYLVRVTGDAPFVEPTEIDHMIEAVLSAKSEYFTVESEFPCVHCGFEVVALSALYRIVQAEDLQEYHREHVTIYLKENIDHFTTVPVFFDEKYRGEGFRLTVDNMADLTLVRTIYEQLWNGRSIVSLEKVIEFLNENPQIKAINQHVQQKGVQEKSHKVVFMIDGGSDVGLGHFIRATSVANFLVEDKHCGVVFVVENKWLKNQLTKAGFNVELLQHEKIIDFLLDHKIDFLFIDVKSIKDVSQIVRRAKDKGVKVILMDNGTDARLFADLNVYPCLTEHTEHLKWNGYTGRVCAGIEYFPLRKELIYHSLSDRGDDIVISMGGSDPYNITMKVIEQLVVLDRHLNVILGPANQWRDEINEFVLRYDNVTVYHSPSNFVDIISKAALVVTGYGAFMYELAYMNVPFIVIAHGKNKEKQALQDNLKKLGCYAYLGYHTEVDYDVLKDVVQKAPKELIVEKQPDSQGTSRITKAIFELVR